MPSMYAEYLAELTDDQIVEMETGFATYRYLSARTVYLVDIFVKQEFRNLGTASAIADTVVALAKEQGCTELLGTVRPSAKGSTASLKVLLGYGMTLVSSANDAIVFRKDI